MALDELFKTFEFLKKRIEEHREYLSQDETRTRQVLIDPLLKELGWDVGDPGEVELEYQIEKQYDVGKNRADYVLKSGSKLAAVIEAKRLGSALSDKATNQVLNYANAKGVPWMLVSDGNEWTMYEVFKRGELNERVRMSFVVSATAASECALKSLALWRPNICEADGPVDAVEPVLTDDAPQLTTGSPSASEVEVDGIGTQRGRAISPEPAMAALADQGNWLTLFEKHPTKSKPTHIRVGDGSTKEVKTWVEAYVEVARSLYETNALNRSKIPMTVPGGKRYLVNRSPENADGSAFYIPKQFVQGLWLDAHGGAKYVPGKAVHLLRQCGVDPRSVEVKVRHRGN